jgi:SRSO17 transposase
MEVVVSHMHTSVVPKASPKTLPELAAYLEPFAPLFRRSTSRTSVERYLTGLLTDLSRKNCDTIAAAVAGTSTERLQHLLTDAAWGVPFAYVVTDAGYGDNPSFLQGLDDRHVAYVVGISSTFGVRLPAEVHAAARVRPSPRRRGQPKKPRPAPLYAAQAVLEVLSADRWQPITWREYGDVVLRKRFTAVRVHWATGGAQFSTSHHRVSTGPEGWLLGEGPLPGERGEVKWYLSTLPADTPLQRLVELAHSRWPILSNSMRMPRASAGWTITRAGAGMGCIDISRWSCWPTVFWRVSAGCLPTRWAFPPSGERPSFPAVHRQVLLWLFQDVVLWLIATNQIAQFRPRRI